MKYTLIFFIIVIMLLPACGGGALSSVTDLIKRIIGRGGNGYDITVPMPQVKRTDVLYGYYGAVGEQVAETKDHINLFMESQFDGRDKAIKNILDAKLPTILDVSPQVFTPDQGGNSRYVAASAERDLKDLLVAFQASGALEYVDYIYPMDEPNITMRSEQDLVDGIKAIKRVVAEFPELNGVKYMAIYATKHPYMAFDQYDIVGLDDYGQKSSILVGADYTFLKNNLLPGQKTVIVPGGAGNWKQDPTPFVNYALGNPEVAIVMPFIWFDNINGRSDSTYGIRSGDLKDAYIAAGKTTINK